MSSPLGQACSRDCLSNLALRSHSLPALGRNSGSEHPEGRIDGYKPTDPSAIPEFPSPRAGCSASQRTTDFPIPKSSDANATGSPSDQPLGTSLESGLAKGGSLHIRARDTPTGNEPECRHVATSPGALETIKSAGAFCGSSIPDDRWGEPLRGRHKERNHGQKPTTGRGAYTERAKSPSESFTKPPPTDHDGLRMPILANSSRARSAPPPRENSRRPGYVR